ncbi:hypothetical protein PENTCL1PPCAC_30313, partial [Pristionchus entomophagus]
RDTPSLNPHHGVLLANRCDLFFFPPSPTQPQGDMVSLQDQTFTSSARPLMAEGSRSALTLGSAGGKHGSRDMEGGRNSESTVSEHHKLGWIVTALFIVADMVGGGVVAMPVAFTLSGLHMGVFFMVSIALVFLYTGWQLGVVWNIMQERWPEYHDHCRKPFPEIAKRSMGPRAKKFTSLLINVTLFGICVVYLLLSANIAHYFVDNFLPDPFRISYCWTIVVLAVMLLPFTYLKSPADFWPVIVLAMVTTTLAVIAIVTGVLRDAPVCKPAAHFPPVETNKVIISIGTFLFAFSGHFVFPSIQHDMREPKKFSWSVSLGFLLVVMLYMPLSTISFWVYGNSMESSVIYSVQTYWLQCFANFMIAVHCILTLVIVVNPVNQELEHFFKVAHHFGKGRVALRTSVLAAVCFVGLTVPDFLPVMGVVGASTIPLGCVVLPSLFYLWINAAEEYEWQKNKIPSLMDVLRRTKKTTLAWNIFLLVLAVGGGAIATGISITDLKDTNFKPPCYLSVFVDQGNVTFGGGDAGGHGFSQHCCGEFKNVSSFLSSCGGEHATSSLLV